MTHRSQFWTTVIALLVWQLSVGSFAQRAAMSSKPAVLARASMQHCVGHERISQVAEALSNSSTEEPSFGYAPPDNLCKDPCCGTEGCRCQGAASALALAYLGMIVRWRPAPPAPAPDGAHLNPDPSDPFRPPIPA